MIENLNKLIGMLFKPLKDLTNYFVDIIRLFRNGENFIFNQLTQRSLDSENGVAHLSLWPLANIFIITGKKYIKGVTNLQDPEARTPFKDLEDFLGKDLENEDVVLKVKSEEYQPMRGDLIKFFIPKKAAQVTQRVFKNIFDNWKEPTCINDKVDLACAKIISSVMYNVEDLPEEIVPLLRQAEHAVFNRRQIGEAEFQRIKKESKVLSDVLSRSNHSRILDESHPDYHPNHLKLDYDRRKNKKKTLEDFNAFSSLIVAGNIQAVLTGMIALLAQRGNGLFDRLKDELKDCNLKENPDLSEDKYPFLHSLYLEGLRYFAPAGPIVRASSQWETIEDLPIPPRSYIIVPTRAILHNPRYWSNPTTFDPDRNELKAYKLNEYPFIPFSVRPRQCLASNGLIKAMFKYALIMLKDYDLRLDENQELEVLPSLTKEPRLQTHYLAYLQRAEPQGAANSSNQALPNIESRSRYSPQAK